MATTLLGPMLPVLAARWSMSDTAAGALFTAQFTGSLIATTVSSLLAARLSVPRTLTLGFALIAAGVGALGFVPAPLGLAFAVVYGLGLGLVLPLTNNVVAALAGRNAASALNLVNVAWGVGAMSWPIVVTAALAIEPRAATTALAAAALVVAVLWGSGHFAAGIAIGAPAASADSTRPTPRATSLIGVYGVLILLYVGSEMAVSGWASEFARRMPAGGVHWTYAATAFWAAQTAGRLLAPLSIRRFGEAVLLVGGIGTGCIATMAMAWLADTAAHVIGLAALTGAALAPVFPVLWARVIRDVAPVQPSAVGPLFAAGGVGGAVLPWLVGLVSTGHGLAAGLIVPLTALAGMLAVLLTRSAPPSGRGSADRASRV